MSNTTTNINTNTGLGVFGSARAVTLSIGLAVALLFTACSPNFGGIDSSAVDLGVEPAAAATTDPLAQSTYGAASAELYTNSSTRAVVTVDELSIYDGPNGAMVGTLGSLTEYGTTRVLLVEATAGNWIQVRLPTRPNHSTGWVLAEDVDVEHVEPVVHIDLQTKKLSVISEDGLIAQATVAIGSAENPTPQGTFYITDKLQTPDPGGAYGPYAFGLSGYSETLSEFAGGNGQIGIHGTNDPSSLGQSVSHGCIRLPNDVVAFLADFLPLGTPVHIV